jgi:molybdate transport system permease protein
VLHSLQPLWLVRAIRLSLDAIHKDLEGAAETLGASKWQVFTHITLPLAAPGIAAGTILTFIKALGEFGATITFVSNIPNETQTLSLAIYSLLQTPDGDSAAWRLIIISIMLAFAALLASERLETYLVKRNAQL